MAKQVGEQRASGSKRPAKLSRSSKTIKIPRHARSGKLLVAGTSQRASVVMRAAEASGLLKDKSKRIGGRISPALLEQAKKHTGIEGDTELIEFALANLALEDDFASTFRTLHGTVDPKLALGLERD